LATERKKGEGGKRRAEGNSTGLANCSLLLLAEISVSSVAKDPGQK